MRPDDSCTSCRTWRYVWRLFGHSTQEAVTPGHKSKHWRATHTQAFWKSWEYVVLAKLILHVNETTAVAVMNFQNVLLSSVLTIAKRWPSIQECSVARHASDTLRGVQALTAYSAVCLIWLTNLRARKYASCLSIRIFSNPHGEQSQYTINGLSDCFYATALLFALCSWYDLCNCSQHNGNTRHIVPIVIAEAIMWHFTNLHASLIQL